MADFFSFAPQSETWHAAPSFFLEDPDGDEDMAFSFPPGAGNAWEAQAQVFLKSGSVRFVPLDHNPPYEAIAIRAKENRCDGFLHSPSRKTIVFVELKNRVQDYGLNEYDWTKKATAQLYDSIKRFREHHPEIEAIPDGSKRAVIANKQCPYWAGSSMREFQAKFIADRDTQGYLLQRANDIYLGDVQ